MKKILTVFLSLLILVPLFTAKVEATNNYSISVNQTITVTIDTPGDYAAVSFTPTTSGPYVFYSTSSFDTYGRLYCGTEFLISDDDNGDGNNFWISYELIAGETYTYQASFYDDQATGSYNVTLERAFAFAVEPDVEAFYGETVTLVVDGKCREMTGVEYTWYEYSFDIEEGEYVPSVVAGYNSYSLTTTVYQTTYYMCYVDCDEENNQVQFSVMIDNCFAAWIKDEKYLYISYASKLSKTFNVIADGAEDDGIYFCYYAYDMDTDDITFLGSNTTGTYTFEFTPHKPEFMILAFDKYNNLADLYVDCIFVNEALYVGETKNITNDLGKTYIFIPEADGDYIFESEGDSDPRLTIYDEYYNYITSYDDNAGRNFYGSVELEAGELYYVDIYMYDFDTTCSFSVEGPGGTPTYHMNLTNNGKFIDAVWYGVKGATKFNLYRRVKGTSSWTTIASNINSIGYSDNKNLSMGTTYEYAIKYYKNGKWSSMMPVAEILRNPFTDIDETHAHFRYVSWAYNKAIVNGVTDYEFHPEGNCTRGQFAIMLWKLCGKPSVSGSCPFVDIGHLTANMQKAILWAYKKGIVKGVDSTHFDPDNSTTRGQMAIMLWRVAKCPNVTGDCPFEDIDIEEVTANMKKAIIWAYQKGITKGTTATTYGPMEYCTRSQLTCFFYRINNLLHLIK